MIRPPFIVRLEQSDPEFLEQVRGLSNFAMTDGALPAKTKILMTVLGEALLRREEGVKIASEIARNIGATDAEIRETVRLAFVLGGLPALSAATLGYSGKGE
ncbi:MAG: carboxymuconolactone decarboxylase family protein [Acidobacteria bacterium]|nr:carboxymuconolactone decarboxylase family protein [Acidobacteriota bacterium]